MTIRFVPNQEGSTPARANILSNAYNGTQTIDLFGIGIIPRIVLEPGEVVMMDSIPLGAPMCKSIKISNPGSDTLRITNDYLSSADGDFSYTPLPKVNGVAKIAPNGSVTVQVCVTPLQNGTRRARLRFTTNIPLTMAQDGPRMDTSAKSVEIWANGVPADRTIIAMGEFTDVVIGDESAANVTLTNAGSESVTIEAPVFSGGNASSFKATKANFPLSVAPGANVNFTVVGTPTVRGANTAALNLTAMSGDRTSTQTAALSVNGLLASSQTNENSLSFAKLYVGEESSQAITITNDGDISQSYIANVSGAGYSLVSDGASDVVTPGSSVIYTIKYAPSLKGISTGVVTVKGTHIADISVSLSGEADEKPVTQSVKGDVSKNGFILSQNAPNPASGKTAFSFTTPTTSNLHITLVDMTGKTVKNLVNGVYGAGSHEVTVVTSEIASGSYLYILETEGVRLVRQMVINK